jgi:hypothetical protein
MHTCHPSRKLKNEGFVVWAGLGKKWVKPYLQNNKNKKPQGVVQEAEHLPSKYKALSSNHSTAK